MALEELRRKYKIMEGNRKSYVEDAQNHIRRQRQTIDKLKFDNSQLKNELSEELKDASLNPAPSTQAEILRLADFADLYTRKIEMERRPRGGARSASRAERREDRGAAPRLWVAPTRLRRAMWPSRSRSRSWRPSWIRR